MQTFVAMLARDDYLKIVKRLSSDVGKKKVEFIQSIPYFSQLSYTQSQYLLRNAHE